MKILVVAVGTRLPQWINDGFAEYAGRMPKNSRISLVEVKPEPRTSGKTVPQMMAAEATRIEAAVPQGCERIVLDEHGRDFSSVALSGWLNDKLEGGRDLAFIIGGPDGLAPSVKSNASLQMRLSSLTLPHGMARVLLAEQLYRSVTILQNHPYHRE
jgi:23S rRNA (pseudouridine1915-N3)-methyltransferase